jgi:ketosteroid isomerase-like protein
LARARAAAAAVAAILLLAAALGGCGGESDPDAARKAVSDFSKAFAAGDGDRACKLLTPDAQAEFVKRVKALTKASDCPAALRRVSQAAGSQVTGAFRTAKVSDVQVKGSSATAKLTAGKATTTVGLAKSDGKWRLTGVPGL